MLETLSPELNSLAILGVCPPDPVAMPSKRSTATKQGTTKVDGVATGPKSLSRISKMKRITTLANGAEPAHPSPSSPSKASVISKPATAKSNSTKFGASELVERPKRKVDNEEAMLETKHVKRRKANEGSIQPPAPPVASKKPKVQKPKVVINHPPTDRLNIYVFGTGDNGELGLGTEKGQIIVKRPRLNPRLAADSIGVVHVAVGGSHTAVLTHDNRILTWGVNDEGALGRDVTWDAPTRDIDDEKNDDDSDSDGETGINPREAIPTEIDMSGLPADAVFTQLASGDSCTFALTDEGLVYGWGTFRVCSWLYKSRFMYMLTLCHRAMRA